MWCGPGAGKDALLVCDTIEMADALNQRIHRGTIAAGTATVGGTRGHRIAVGDLIVSRHNDASIPLRHTDDPAAEHNPVRNGQRWCVTQINRENNRLIARRLDDNTRGAFFNGYVREHITHGYAVTVHGAKGVTADTTQAVLGKNTKRPMLYVAMTRGRETNDAYLYERATEQEYGLNPQPGADVMDRGTAAHAGRLARAIIANHDQPITAHQVAARTRAPHPRPPRIDGPAPAGNLPTLASRRAELRPGDDHRARAPQQPQPKPEPRRRDRDVVTLGWRRRNLSCTSR